MRAGLIPLVHRLYLSCSCGCCISDFRDKDIFILGIDKNAETILIIKHYDDAYEEVYGLDVEG